MNDKGGFDPFRWAADPNRRNDIYGATAVAPHLTSHAAIVARGLGIPAVVGCGSATTLLRSGDRVRVDGGLGTVEFLNGGS